VDPAAWSARRQCPGHPRALSSTCLVLGTPKKPRLSLSYRFLPHVGLPSPSLASPCSGLNPVLQVSLPLPPYWPLCPPHPTPSTCHPSLSPNQLGCLCPPTLRICPSRELLACSSCSHMCPLPVLPFPGCISQQQLLLSGPLTHPEPHQCPSKSLSGQQGHPGVQLGPCSMGEPQPSPPYTLAGLVHVTRLSLAS
jgi:hypothetical protein